MVEWGWTKNIAHYESYGKTDNKNEHNIREYHMNGYNKDNLCQHNKLNPLKARRGKYIS